MNWITRHIRTVSTLSSLDESEVRRLFCQHLHVSIDPALSTNPTYQLAYAFAINLLSRSFPNTTYDSWPTVQLPILPSNDFRPVSSKTVLRVHFGRKPQDSDVVVTNMQDWHVISDDYDANVAEHWNPFLALFGACTAASRATAQLLGSAVNAASKWRTFSILDWENGTVPFDWREQIDFGVIHLAGVGAVGTAFLYALLAYGRSRGRIYLLDHEVIDEGNIGRYVLFSANDIGLPKVDVSARWIEATSPSLRAIPKPQRLQDFMTDQLGTNKQFRIEKLISAPDRRDTRREFQTCLPRHVWDASTGPDQVVWHRNSFLRTQACMACIYFETPDEEAHLRHVANKLNVPLQRVKKGDPITRADAVRIHDAYAQLPVEVLVGKAFDSVFRELCGAGQLRMEGRQLLAPLPFISATAGIGLAFEMFKSHRPDVFGRYQEFNYAQINPFFPPNPAVRESRMPHADCFCQLDRTRNVFSQLWMEDNTGATL